MNTLQIIAVVCATPFVVYFCIKFGRIAWLQANRRFRESDESKPTK